MFGLVVRLEEDQPTDILNLITRSKIYEVN